MSDRRCHIFAFSNESARHSWKERWSLYQPLVPDYELIRRIGGGAYGEVFLARSKATGVLRAAKIVWRRSFDDDRPFQREFEGIQRFERISREHPSQLALFHIGRNEAEGYFYYVMELADDVEARQNAESYSPRTLRAELAHGRLPATQALEIGVSLNHFGTASLTQWPSATALSLPRATAKIFATQKHLIHGQAQNTPPLHVPFDLSVLTHASRSTLHVSCFTIGEVRGDCWKVCSKLSG